MVTMYTVLVSLSLFIPALFSPTPTPHHSLSMYFPLSHIHCPLSSTPLPFLCSLYSLSLSSLTPAVYPALPLLSLPPSSLLPPPSPSLPPSLPPFFSPSLPPSPSLHQ